MNPTFLLAWFAAWTLLGSAVLLLTSWMVRHIRQAQLRHLAWLGAFSCVMFLPFFAIAQSNAPQPPAWCIATCVNLISSHPWSSLVITFWLLGMVAALARVCWALRIVHHWRGRSGEYPLPQSFLFHAPVKVSSEKVPNVPMIVGLFFPVILLPQGARAWEPSRLLAVLSHELGHIRRRDHLWQLFALFACACHWFNPVFWFAARRMEAEAEMAADDFAISHGVKPSSYAAELLAVARELRFNQSRIPLATTAMVKTFTLEDRLRSITDPKATRGPVPFIAYGRATFMFAATASGVMLATSWFSPLIEASTKPVPSCVAAAQANQE